MERLDVNCDFVEIVETCELVEKPMGGGGADHPGLLGLKHHGALALDMLMVPLDKDIVIRHFI